MERRTRQSLSQRRPAARTARGAEQGTHACLGPKCRGCVWCWHSGVPCPLRWPLRRHCSRTRAATPPPPLSSRRTLRHSEAAAFCPAQRGARGTLGGGQRSWPRRRKHWGTGSCGGSVARVGSAARLIFFGGGVGAGVVQQLHHLEQRALGGGVVQGALDILREAPCIPRGLDRAKGKAKLRAELRWQHGRRVMCRAARLILCGGGFGAGLEQQLDHIQ